MSSAMSERYSSVRDPRRDSVADLRRTARGAVPVRQIREDRLLHLTGRLLETDVVQQQRGREDRRGRVGLLLTRDVGRGPVYGLEHAGGCAVGVDVAARGQADST